MYRKGFLLILLVVLLVCGPRSVSQAVAGKIYWTDAGTDKIQCAKLDGSNVQDLITRPHRLGDPHGIALDIASGKIYWADEGTDKIQSANLDGSYVQDLIEIRDVRSPTSIALDVDSVKMYWIQTLLFSSEIWCANLNGSGQQRILRTSLDSINGIALDTTDGKMYWTQAGFLASSIIRRANLDGSNIQTLVTGLGYPSGIALDVDDGKMYWVDSHRHKIQRANLDGSNVQNLVTSGLDAPSDIALDVDDDKMYWVEKHGDRSRRANLDGSNVQTLVSGLSRPLGITLSISEPESIAEDVNKDGIVNIVDLTLVASNFGATGANAADVNEDGVVNIVDLTLVAAAFGNTAAAPFIWNSNSEIAPTRVDVEAWLQQARQLNLADPAFQRGIRVLEQLLAAMIPKETALLPNYPNPFNPETWIPYQLASPADVSISIYAVDGTVVRTLSLGHQPIGMYHQRSRAAYWDGKNASGEPVASGVYYYTLTAGKFIATRKMLINK